MKRKIKKAYCYVPLILLLNIIVASCRGIDPNSSGDGNESDEEALGHMRQLNEGIEKSNKEIKEREDTIGTRESLRDCLGENNNHLEEELKEKQREVLEILKEIYDDSKSNKTYTATCKDCHKEVCITYDKFYEMAKRYNTGWTRWYSYSWFLFWKWGCKTERFEFHQCPECVTQEGIARYQRMLWENRDEIAKVEAKLVKDRLKLKKAQEHLQERETSQRVMNRMSARKEELKGERDQLKRENDNLKVKSAEQARELTELKLNTARALLRNQVDINVIIRATGLTRQQIESIGSD